VCYILIIGLAWMDGYGWIHEFAWRCAWHVLRLGGCCLCVLVCVCVCGVCVCVCVCVCVYVCVVCVCVCVESLAWQ